MSDSTFRKRLLLFVILVGLGGIIIVVQYAGIMLGNPLQGNRGTSATAVDRGPIMDRNGRLLALQTVVYTCAAWGPNLKDNKQTSLALAPLIGLTADKIEEKLKSAKGSVILKTGIVKSEADPINALIDAGKLPGIYLEEAVSRSYPEGRTAAQVIGFTGAENEGMEGMEYVLDNQLLNKNTTLPDGRAYGNQVYLTLDMVMQSAMEKIADKAVAENKPEQMMLLVMDAQTGEMLSWVVRPTYDPANFRQSSPDDRRNLPVQFTYEPGSVFKIFTLSSFMQLGGVNDSTQFQTSGGYHNKLFRDPITDLGDYGLITPEGIIKYSSNVGAAFASDTVTNEQFYGMLHNFGFDQKTGITMHGEESGILKTPDAWSPRTKPTVAIGQEINVTAIQMVQAATVLANDGVMLKPQIIRRISMPNGKIIAEFGREPLREVLSPAIAHRMLAYMNAATEDGGTGHRSRIGGIDLSVKTGTAQMFDVSKGHYSDKDFIASALTIFPTEQPRIIMYVVFVKPRGDSIYGGRIATPVIHDAAEFIIPFLGIKRDGDLTYTQGSQVRVNLPSLPAFTDTLPDFRGLPLKTLIPLYARQDISIEIHGDGQVTSQNPSPGTTIKPGMKLVLTLQDHGAETTSTAVPSP